jgi:Kef-type K+ transport system membrane component KefB
MMAADPVATTAYLPVIVRFAIIMAICLLTPPLCRRIHIPACVGLLCVGVVVGPNGLSLFPQDGPVAGFMAQLGKLLLMFFAGLEIDLNQFERTGNRSATFGLLTFSIPQIVGTAVAVYFGYGWLSAVLVGSLMASHTLLGFPIVQRMNLVHDEAVAVTIGGTVITDLLSLLVLAICVPIFTTGFSTTGFIVQIVELAAYIFLLLVGLSSLCKWLFEKFGGTKDAQVTLVLLIMALAGIGAEAINLEAIVGAFLAGLAVNRAFAGSEAKDEIEFLGNTLFIPIFFVSIGFLINVPLFLNTLVDRSLLVVGIVGGLIASKFIAGFFTGRIFGYSRSQEHLVWSLSLPQVAATLAAAIVAYETTNAAGERLIDEAMINTVLVMVVVTSILGPVLTEVFGRQRVNELESSQSSSVQAEKVFT